MKSEQPHLREAENINGTSVVLVREGVTASWESNRPIPCSVCRRYCHLMHQYRFEDGDLTVCFAKSRPCLEELSRRLKFMEPAWVYCRAIRCPENTPQTRKRERRQMSYKLRWLILKRDGFRCVKCGGTDRLEIDHIKPIVSGGKTEEGNLQTLCFPCNHGKQAE